LNYDIHDKELLVIFEAFKKWQHYLENTSTPVEVFMDHKNLTYFCGSKVLSWCQTQWSEFLSQFNLFIQFRPRRLGTKPDALTWRQDVYQKDSIENNQTRQPIFTTEQLNDSQLRTGPSQRKLQATIILNTESLFANIRTAMTTDPFCKEFFDAGEPTDNPK